MSSPGDECQVCYKDTYNHKNLGLEYDYEREMYICRDCVYERHDREKNYKKEMLYKLLRILDEERPTTFEALYESLFDDTSDSE